MSTVNRNIGTENLREALALWMHLTGFEPGKKSFSGTLGDYSAQYEVQKLSEKIKKALELDSTNLTGLMILGKACHDYFTHRSFSAYELTQATHDAEFNIPDYLDKTSKLFSLIKSEEVSTEINHFQEQMKTSLEHYNCLTDETMAIVEDTLRLGELRFDALSSMEKLRVNQFLKGAPENTDVKPMYHKSLHRFFNMNTLIQEACSMPSGVTLNMIRDPLEMSSYFAYAIRNGGNLFVLTDAPDEDNPLHKFMSRRPDRDMASRAYKNWFPYHLLDIAVSEATGDLYIDQSKKVGLIPKGQEFDSLTEMKDLSAEEVVWNIMMFDLIVAKFWDKGHQEIELSFTGEMITNESVLLEEAKKTNLPVTSSEIQKLELEALTSQSIKRENLSESDIGKYSTKLPNEWLEERYIDQVSDDMLNIVAPGSHSYFLERKGEKIKESSTALVTMENAGGVMVDTTGKINSKCIFNGDKIHQLHMMDGSFFGTKEEIDANRKFLARFNAAKQIQVLANEEYLARKEDVYAWFKNRVQQNIETLLGYAKEGKVDNTILFDDYPHLFGNFGDNKEQSHTFAELVYIDDESNKYRVENIAWTSDLKFNQGYKSGRPFCFINGTRASAYLHFDPMTAEDVALLAGCKVEDMPDVLQHWTKFSETEGNYILNRVDPMQWALDNPWQKIKFKVTIALSKRAVNKLCK